LRPIIPYPTGRFFGGTFSQALRAWLLSACPSGTKAIHPSKPHNYLSAYGGARRDAGPTAQEMFSTRLNLRSISSIEFFIVGNILGERDFWINSQISPTAI
jgi:hypothetical protein